jgi:HlyD family secretion protein
MDQLIDDTTIRRKRRIRIIWILAAGALFTFFLLQIPSLISPSIKRDRIRTTLVERGAMESTISASGNIIPSREKILSSPVDTRLNRILKQAGDPVQAGEVIVELDTNEIRLQLIRLDEQIALKRNEHTRVELDLEDNLLELGTRLDIQKLELRSLELIRERNAEHYEIGGISKTELEVATVNVARARVGLTKVGKQLELTRRRNSALKEKLELELKILQQEREVAQQRVMLATARAEQGGVVTWVPTHEGIAISRGEEIARIADLTSFRVEARISDSLADQIWIGQLARIQIGEDYLGGQVTNIFPAVEAGIIRLQLDLESNNHPKLRPNLRVEVHLVREERLSTLKLKRGVHVRVGGRPAVFVVRDDIAVRTPIELGIANFDYFEILSGLTEGDQVIQSDMNDYVHLQEVKLQ